MPRSCSRVSFSWLLQDKSMKLRTTYPGFVDAVNLYFDKLVSVIKPLMVSQTQSVVIIFPERTIPVRHTFIFHCLFSQFEEGGPIIAVQVENEYGSYARDEKYMPFIQNVSLLMYCNMLFSLERVQCIVI